MATKSELFLFEVVIEKLDCFVENRELVIKVDFANIFQLELKDPKTMHITIPEPPPLPPEPPGKKKKPPPKKGKKGKEPPPPPEPEILCGQSILITSSAEILVQNMRTNPLVVSLWSKEDTLVYIGSSSILWDEVFPLFLTSIYSCKESKPTYVKDEYNIFEENTAKLIATIKMQTGLSYLTDKVVSSFRTLTEDDAIKKVLYTGMNSKVTSVMCTLKTTDEEYQANLAKIPNKFTKDAEVKPPEVSDKPISWADYKNAPGAVLPYDQKEYCCLGNADKPPKGKYDLPESLADIDSICDYIRKIISSCNDNMRMLRPRASIRPRVRATDIDKLCYCKETAWPKGDLAERFRRETQGGPCPVCIRQIDGKPRPGTDGAPNRVLDIANIRGPCGRPDCRIARGIRAYLEKIVEEDNKEINFEDIVGPCGSKECSLVDKIKDFLAHRGKFSHGRSTQPGLGTVCTCLDQMQDALTRKGSCTSICSHDCESDSDNCGGKACPYKTSSKGSSSSKENTSLTPELPTILHELPKPGDKKPPGPQKPGDNKPPGPQKPGDTKSPGPPKPGDAKPSEPPKPDSDKQVYYVYYFTVEYDNKDIAHSSPSSKSPTSPVSPTTPTTTETPTSASTAPSNATSKNEVQGTKSCVKFKHCAPLCPTAYQHRPKCSKSVCGIPESSKTKRQLLQSCTNIKCPSREAEKGAPATPSPADSDIELRFSDITNPCCVKTCDVSERVKDIIVEGLAKKSRQTDKFDDKKDPCYCDCVCKFPMAGQTTYCSVCGGYELLGTAVKEQPEYLRPHPCPVYHKIKEVPKAKPEKVTSLDDEDGGRSVKGKSFGGKLRTMPSMTNASIFQKSKSRIMMKKDKNKDKLSDYPQGQPASSGKYHKYCHTYTDAVPKHMGWLWNADDIPGMKPWPKNWRPGAANKILVRKYKAIREGVDIILKKKRALANRKKKIEMKPTLVVTKKEGEYTVQMEIFKKYSKERLRFQYPYDEKPPLIYTVGKTEAVKLKEQKQRERKERRENRRKSKMLQSTFRDKCQEICLKAYNQAIGLLPMPNANNPDCPCSIQQVKAPTPVIDSCSCSDEGTLSSSDTDGDDWVIEFTPPMARWDGKAKHPPALTSTESQYNYLDFRVKCLDKQGNQVSRYFKGPDGTEQCSDLGGFYGPDGTWLEINKDGYIGPDNRWVPLNFIGPDGESYLSEDGIFTDTLGNSWKIGIDGYVDAQNNWQWYPGKKKVYEKASAHVLAHPNAAGEAPAALAGVHRIPKKHRCERRNSVTCRLSKENKPASSHASTTKVPEKAPSKVNDKVLDKVPDKSQDKVRDKVHDKEKDKTKKVTLVQKGKTPLAVQTATNFNRRQQLKRDYKEAKEMREIEMAKLARYQEIMEGLRMYDDVRLHAPFMTNRAVDTRAKQNASKYSAYDSNGHLVRNSRRRNFF